MAKFCKYCGSPLEEGQECACGGAVAEVQMPATASEAEAGGAGNGSTLLAELKDVLLCGLKTPRQAASKLENSKNKMAVAGIIAGIHAIAVFLLLLKSMTGLIGGVVSGISDAMGGLLSSAEDIEITYPVFPMILSGIMISAIAIGVAGLLNFAFAKLAKKETAALDCIMDSAVDSLYPSVLLIAATVVGFISSSLQLLVLLLLLVVVIVTAVDNARMYADMRIDQTTKNYISVIVGIFAAIVVVGFTTKLMAIDWCLMAVEIEGATIEEIVEQIGSAANLLGGLLG